MNKRSEPVSRKFGQKFGGRWKECYRSEVSWFVRGLSDFWDKDQGGLIPFIGKAGFLTSK